MASENVGALSDLVGKLSPGSAVLTPAHNKEKIIYAILDIPITTFSGINTDWSILKVQRASLTCSWKHFHLFPDKKIKQKTT